VLRKDPSRDLRRRDSKTRYSSHAFGRSMKSKRPVAEMNKNSSSI
jgi:hypothetical protein